MAVWSSLFVADSHTDTSTASSDVSFIKHVSKQTPSLADALKCYVCMDYYNKPRILPCGHSFCARCLSKLRRSAVEEFNKSRDRNAHKRGDCGFFTCPWPDCHYSMRIMNLTRWAMKNKSLAAAVAMVKKQEQERQDSASQTDIELTNILCTVPKYVFSPADRPYLSPSPPPTPTDTVIRQALQTTLSTESMAVKHYQPPSSSSAASSWRSYVFLVGAAVLDQMLRIS